MPHPEDTTKFIQCTKRGEMFVFKCKNNQEWDAEAAKCDKPKEKPSVPAGAKPLLMKSKTKTKNLGQTNRKVMTFIDSTTVSTSTSTNPMSTTTERFTTTTELNIPAKTISPTTTTSTTTTTPPKTTTTTITASSNTFPTTRTSFADINRFILTTEPSSSLLSMVTSESVGEKLIFSIAVLVYVNVASNIIFQIF